MYEVLVRGRSLPETYHKALKELWEHGEIADCADWKTTQKPTILIFPEYFFTKKKHILLDKADKPS